MSFEADFNKIGPAIRDLRKLKGLTQKALCENGVIISQAQLSRIENGNTYGLWDKIFLIAERLGIDVNYFFEIAKNSDSEFVLGVKNNVRKLVEKREYKTVYKLIKSHKTTPSFYKNKQNLQFLIWHEGICVFNLMNNFEDANNLFKEALNLTYTPPKYITEQELSIMNSMGVISFETSKYDLAISIYQNALREIRHAPVPIIGKVRTRIQYNLAKALSTIGNYKDSNRNCLEGIQICKSNTSYYLMGEFNYQLAFNHYYQEEYHKAKEYGQKAIQVFLVNEDQENLDRTYRAIELIDLKLQG
ncbi:helix-turn-helix domain-containing protein [Bacillus pinisoli]|uniref:helix-turn-helix domain-containing protein n=1 Tax=Bacillus pinisoli TaxID=2901866 RepID=UPI001FF68B90